MPEPSPAQQMIHLLELAGKYAGEEERSSFLETLPDAAMRARLQTLLDLSEGERTQTLRFAPGTPGGAKVVVPFEGTARFKLLETLGTGGFGTVYRVFDSERNTRVALKILRENDPQVLYRFKQEFRTLASLRHRNLLRLYDLFAESDRWFFTMELIEGVSFYEYCRGSLIKLRQALPQLVRALDHLHGQGLLHLDIKPSNVFVTSENRVVLLDFGLVREIFRDGLQSVRLCGTPEFMAPELVQRRQPDESADWYSVGTMLYQALTDQLPFTGSTVEIFAAKLAGPPSPVTTRNGALPADLSRLCEGLLAQQTRDRPGAAEILQHLGESAPRIEASQRDVFVGRSGQLAAMREAWKHVERGGTVVLNLSGRSGFGKSTLLRAFLEELQRNRPDAFVLAGRCRENESVPFKALDEAIDALSQRIASLPEAVAADLIPAGIELAARLFPVLGEICPAGGQGGELAVDSMELRQRAIAALIDLIGRISARYPLVLAIDDLQWGDTDSIKLLGELLSTRRPAPMLLAASFRSEESEIAALRFYRSALAERNPAVEQQTIEVGEFNHEESAEYASQLLGPACPPSRRQIIVQEAAGNPLLIAQLARYSGPESSGLGLQAMIEKRLAEIPAAARSLLETVALADHPLPQNTIQRAAGVDADDFSGVWTLISDRLVRTHEQNGRRQIECYHDKIREAVTSRLDAARRRELHRRLAHTLEEEGEKEAALLATHYAGAGESEKAAHYAHLAAEAAHFAWAFDRAAEFYQLALDHGNQASEQRRTLYRRMATALACASHGERAAGAYVRAAEGAPPDEALNLQRLAAEQYLMAGKIQAGTELLNRVVRSAGVWVPDHIYGVFCSLLFHRLRIALRGLSYRERDASEVSPRMLLAFDVCQTASHCLAPFDHLRTANFHARALLLGLRAGEPRRVAVVLGREAMDCAGRGVHNGTRSDVIMASASTLADRLSEPRLQAELAAFNGTRAMFLGRWRESASELDRAVKVRIADDAENAWLTTLVGGLYFSVLPYTGEIRLLSEQLASRFRDFETRHNPFGLMNLRVRASHLVWLAADDPEHARREVDHGTEPWPANVYLLQKYFEFVANVEIDLYRAAASPDRGVEVEAYDRISREWKPLRHSLLRRLEVIQIESHQLRARTAVALAAVAPERREILLREAARDVRSILARRADWARPQAAVIQAAIAAIRGDRRQALLELALAEQGFLAHQMPLHLAAVRRQAGLLMGGEEGRARIAAADAWMADQTIRNPARMADVMVPGFRKLSHEER